MAGSRLFKQENPLRKRQTMRRTPALPTNAG
jgi:hypothetical protein